MESTHTYLLRKEFELRIFISLGIVVIIAGLSFTLLKNSPALLILIGEFFGIPEREAIRVGYFFVAGVMMIVSLLRMWAGSILSSERVMAFRVQVDSLHMKGPYRLVRNPIYLADLIAFAGFTLVLPWIGILLPILIYIHYIRLIDYEEISLNPLYGQMYQEYRKTTPRLLPNIESLKKIHFAFREFSINKDGFRHNGIYVLFVPGFIIASFTGELYLALLIGFPCVIDWAIVHTKLGVKNKETGSPSQTGKGVFGDVLYANCWEDPQTDRRALSINNDDVVFSITSGGCNVLAFLIDNPKKVIALDINPHQNYLLELKIAAFKMLTYDELLGFVGVDACTARRETYRKLRECLTDSSRSYWDSRRKKIEMGIIHCGRYERYMRMLRTLLIVLIGRRLIDSIMMTEDPAEREKIFNAKWENRRWRLFTRIMLSRAIMTALFDKAFFKYLENDFPFGMHFAQKARRALTDLPVSANPYLHYILTGGYRKGSGIPLYLRPEHFPTIKARIDRIEIVTESCEDYFVKLPPQSISKFNFSNIFEWMPEEQFEALLNLAWKISTDGSVIVYRNLLVYREHPHTLRHLIISHKEKARVLLDEDLSFIYNNYVMEEFKKETTVCHTKLKVSKIAVR